MIASLPPGWSTADFNAWFNPIYLDATAQRDIYVYAHTPRELQTNVAEWLVTGSTSSPLPISWSMKEFTDWITALINEALAAYYVDILSQTPAYLLSPVKERINYQQPPPTTDLIGGGGALTPGTPGVPGVLPAGATLTRASTAWYWEGSNYIRNPSGVGAGAAVQPTFWGVGGTLNGLSRTYTPGVEDGIPYVEMRYFGTPIATSSTNVEFEVRNSVAALIGQTWTGSFYVRLMPVGTGLTNTGLTFGVRENDAAGGQLANLSQTAVVPTGAALRTQKIELVRTLTNPAVAFVNEYVNVAYTTGLPVDITFRIGLPRLTTTSKPFVPQLYQVNPDAPRFACDPFTGAPLGLLNEPAATNLLFNSQTGVGAQFSVGRASITTNATTAPTGAVTASKLVEDTSGGNNHVLNLFSGALALNDVATISFYAKAGERTRVRLRYATGFVVSSAFFDLTTGLIDTIGGTGTFAIEKCANGWYRCSGSHVVATAGSCSAIVELVQSGITTSYTGDGVSGTYVWGLNWTITPLSSYIDTTTAAVTRAADVFNAPVPNGTYNIDVVRSSTTTYASQVITTGKWLVPNDPSPVRSVAAKVVAAEALTFNFMMGAGVLPAGATLARASIGWAMATPNSIRNPTASGAVVGTPGTNPTNWQSNASAATVARNIIATGTEDGIPYVDYQWVGTPTSNNLHFLAFDASAFIAALPGQVWSSSVYLRLVAGSLTNVTLGHAITERNGTGTSLGNAANVVPAPTAAALSSQRSSVTGTLVNAGTLFTINQLTVTFTANNPINLTLRIGLPTLVNTVPALTSYAINLPRWPVDPTSSLPIGLYNERAVTNFVRNASCGGVVPGTPGTAPTLWNVASTANGITRECVGSGVEDGIPYFDVRYFGTPSGGSSATIRPEAPTTTVAAAGETWLAQFNYRLMAGSMTNAGVRVVLGYRDGGGAGISGPATTVVTPTNAPLRTQSATMSWTAPATTATVNSDIRVDWTVGNAIDITLRVGAPQMIQLDTPRSPILSTNAALLRAADVLTAAQANVLPGFWDVTVTRQSGATVARGIDLTAGGTLTYVVPTDASPVQSVKFAPSV